LRSGKRQHNRDECDRCYGARALTSEPS
jgi:hypothetical protein